MKASKEKKNIQLKTKGKTGFEEYYSSLFGERWQNLKESFATESVRTLNPMIIAFDVDANVTSDSLIAPTPP